MKLEGLGVRRVEILPSELLEEYPLICSCTRVEKIVSQTLLIYKFYPQVNEETRNRGWKKS